VATNSNALGGYLRARRGQVRLEDVGLVPGGAATCSATCLPRLWPTTITGPSIRFRDIASQEGVGEPPGDVGAGAPGIDFGSLRAADGNQPS
jgi:hypothetical protein